MNNRKGVTLISLVTTVILIIMLASMTAVTSMNSYNQMRFETFQSKLEEVQRKVDEMCVDYQNEKANNIAMTISDYFNIKYSSIPQKASVVTDSDVKLIYDKYTLNSHADSVFYFKKDEIKKYFGLEGFEDDSIIVDFATRYVYSVKGCKNPEDKTDIIYYTLSDTGSEIAVSKSDENASKSTSNNIKTKISKNDVNGTKIYTVTLTLERELVGKDYPIKKAYYKQGEKWIEVDYLGDCKYTETTVSFVIYTAGTYTFKVEDTYGKSLEVSATLN